MTTPPTRSQIFVASPEEPATRRTGGGWKGTNDSSLSVKRDMDVKGPRESLSSGRRGCQGTILCLKFSGQNVRGPPDVTVERHETNSY